MTLKDPDDLVRQLVDGELPADDVQAALRRIAADPAACRLLRLELQWTEDLVSRTDGAPAVPDGFADRTMAALAAEEARADEDQTATALASAASLMDRLRRRWDAWTAPLTVQVRPVYGLVAALLFGALAWSLRPALHSPTPSVVATAPESAEPTTARTAAVRGAEVVWTRFVFTAEDAKSVAVAGDFSQWEPISLTPHTVDGQTVWTGLVPVRRGEHEYQFVIDGSKWVTDPLAPVKREDGFGAKNAVIKL